MIFHPSCGPDKWTGSYTPVHVRPVAPAFADPDMSSRCPRHVRARNLTGWLNEPVVQAVVVRMLTEAETPLVLRDFVATGGLRIASANRVLLRLHERGLVTRYKLPMQRHYYCHKRKACVPGGAVRWVFAYTRTGE